MKDHKTSVPHQWISDEDVKKEYVSEIIERVENFKQAFNILNKEFGVALTPKIHVIYDHLVDIVKICGKAIGETNDQVIETVHQWVKKRMTTSMYVVRCTETDSHGEKLL